MLEINVNRSIYSVKKEWQQLEMEGKQSPFQSFELNKLVYDRWLLYSKRIGGKPAYVCLYENKKIVLIAPLAKNGNIYSFIGGLPGYEFYDFIYSDKTTVDQMKRYFLFLMASLNIEELRLSDVPEKSLVFRTVSIISCDNDGRYNIKMHSIPNVNINFGKDSNVYYNSLSKHVRQNLRTAYNRIERDGLSLDSEFISGESLGRKQLNELVDIHFMRKINRYSIKQSDLKRLYFRYFDFSTLFQNKASNNIYGVLYIDKKVAAFFSGVTEQGNGGRAYIPRLAINEEYGKYSPGSLLINESAKYLPSELNIENLDLVKGDELYKLSMGGKVYHSHEIIINTL